MSLLLGGFSEASEDMSQAKADCLQIFQTVKDFLGPQALNLPDSWLGNDFLDKLWTRSNGDCNINQWPCDAIELCDKLQINVDRREELWTTITVAKEYSFQPVERDGTLFLKIEEIEKYLAHLVLLNVKKGTPQGQIEGPLRQIIDTLKRKSSDGLINPKDYDNLARHLDKKHGNDVAKWFSWPLKGRKRSSVALTSAFEIPFHSRYGLINIGYLRVLSSSPFSSDMLQPLLDRCIELRGFSEAQGIYIPMPYFMKYADAMQIHFDKQQINLESRDSSFDNFTHQDWYLVAPHESSDIFAVNRATDGVRLSDSEELPLPAFLEKYFPRGTHLDGQTAHKPEWLVTPPEASTHSICNTTIRSSDDSMKFKFGRRLPLTPPVPEAKEGDSEHSRIEDWVEAGEDVRLKRRGSGVFK